jgi:hypothetical protein
MIEHILNIEFFAFDTWLKENIDRRFLSQIIT